MSTTKPEGLAFVNDWGVLTRAIEVLKKDNPYDMDLGEWDCNSQHWSGPAEDAVYDLIQWVPKLIDSWSELWELSLNLVALVEAQKLNETPAGIYLPDTSVKLPAEL